MILNAGKNVLALEAVTMLGLLSSVSMFTFKQNLLFEIYFPPTILLVLVLLPKTKTVP